MKTNPTRENAAMLTKRADNGAPADSRPPPQIAPKARQIGPIFAHEFGQHNEGGNFRHSRRHQAGWMP
jgi:hypothetical protein